MRRISGQRVVSRATLFLIHKLNSKKGNLIDRIVSKFLLTFLFVMFSSGMNLAEGVPGTPSFLLLHAADDVTKDKKYGEWTIEEWQGKFKSIHPEHSESADYLPALVEIFTDKTVPDQSRAQAAYLVARMGKKARTAVPQLVQILNSENSSDARFWVLKSIEIFGKEAIQAGEPIREIAISDKESEPLRQAALEALIQIGPEFPQTIPALIRILTAVPSEMDQEEKDDPKYASQLQLAVQAAQGLKTIGNKATAAFPFLLRQVEHPHEMLRMECVNAIAAMSSRAEPAIPILLALISMDESAAVRDAAGIALGNMGDVSVPGLVLLLEEPSEETRLQVLKALVLTGTKSRSVREKLTELIEDKNPLVSVEAAYTFWMLFKENEPVLPVLIDRITHEERDVRTKVIETITVMGSSAKDLVPLLEILLEDSRAYVRTSAGKALDIIGRSEEENK